MAYLKDLSPDHPGHILGAGEVPSLDGLRAISVLIVMVAHSGLHWIVPGGFGVTMFFFISGFIITTLLVREQAKHDRIDVGSFYVRRALRLYPALLAFIAAIVVAYALTSGLPDKTGIAGGLLYFMNYLVIFSPDKVLPQSNHLWSLAVEAHFYLVYPWLFLLFGANWRRFSIVLAVVCALALAIRIWASINLGSASLIYEYAYQASEARLDSIAFGALCATLLLSPAGSWVARWLTTPWVVALGLATLGATLLLRNPVFRDTVRYSLQGIALMPVITAAVIGGARWLEGPRSLLNSSAMLLGGALSYSLYLWHPALFALGPRLTGAEAPGIVLGWILAVAVAMLSYYGIERPMLTIRSRFGSAGRKLLANGGATPERLRALPPVRASQLYVVDSDRSTVPEPAKSSARATRRPFLFSQRRNIP